MAGVAVAAALLPGCSIVGGDRFEATALCTESAAELVWDPEDRIEVRVADQVAAWADDDGREVDFDVCDKTATQQGWFVGIPYTHTKKPVTLSCRFRGRFFVHVHPTYSSEGGGSADGSAVYLVIGKKRTLVASAGTGEKAQLSYWRRYCTPT